MRGGIMAARVLLAVVAGGTSAGCGTIASRGTNSPDWDTRVYGGVVDDAGELTAAFRGEDEDGVSLLVAPIVLLDIPLSFVADTLLLPWTIPEQFGQRRKEVRALVAAIEAGDLAGAQAAARRRPEVLNARVRRGNTPLHVAVEGGKSDLVDWLARDASRHDARNDTRNADGITPLGLAAGAGRADLARILLDAGADPEAVSAGRSLLFGAVERDDTALATLLLERGASPKATDRWGSTALHVAAGQGRTVLAELLLANGADPRACDGDGWTPLHLAARGGKVEVARVLLAHGADVNARSWRRPGEALGTRGAGDTPLGEALHQQQAQMVALLRDRGGVE